MSSPPLRRWHSRRFAPLLLLPLGLLLITLLYMLGMGQLEGQTRSFWESLAWAAETLTTTGYGHDSYWGHPLMIVFVVAVQFIGVFLVFLLFPVIVIPFLEARFEERLPRTLPEKLRDFVLIYRYGPAVTSLIRDMERHRIPSVVLEEDEALARRLRDRGLHVVLSRLEDESPFSSGLEGVRALVANGADHQNAVAVLSAREGGFRGPIYVFAENPLHRKPIVLAGATAAYSPKHALAAALAAQASDRISPRIAGLQQLGAHLEVAELRIQRESPVANLPLAEARIRERTGATVIGRWMGGEFTAEVGPATRLRPGSILVAVGSGESIERVGSLATPLAQTGPFLVAGYGEVGRKVVEMLADAGETTVVIDKESQEGVDLVADALDSEALRSAGVLEARAVILALSSDAANLFATTVVREIAPDVPIIARVNRAEEVARIRATGADFALSVGQVAGQLLGRQLFGEEFIPLESRVRLVKTSAVGLGNLNPASARIRERTGCSIVVIERDRELFVEFDRDFEIRPGDSIYICGSEEAVDKYFELFPEARPNPVASSSPDRTSVRALREG
jgi:Trk K+ transport system NAD-binding subunit